MNTHADPLERPRLNLILTTMVINIATVALLTQVSWSDWKTGLGLNLFDNALLLAFVAWRRDFILGKLLVFGLAVGIAELAADAWLVDGTGTLDYSIGGGPMLWRSPLWMPIAWEIVAVQFSGVGLWLCARWGTPAGLAAIGILGAVNIPYYEEVAKRIRWWQYSDCRMISNTPYYIILGELLIAIALTLLAKPLARAPWSRVTLLGLAGGASIFIAYAVAYGITDGFARH